MEVWVLTITTSYGAVFVDSAYDTMEKAQREAEQMHNYGEGCRWETLIDDEDDSICGCFTSNRLMNVHRLTIKKLTVNYS